MPGDDKRLTARLRAIEDDPTGSVVEETLSEALASSHNRIVGRAAKLVGQLKLGQFEDDLRTAYARFLMDPTKSDPGCEAKTWLCEALRQIEHDDADFFLTEMHYRQYEPIYRRKILDACERRRLLRSCSSALRNALNRCLFAPKATSGPPSWT